MTIPAGTNPDGIICERSTNTLWAFNGASKNATVIDVASREVVGTVALERRGDIERGRCRPHRLPGAADTSNDEGYADEELDPATGKFYTVSVKLGEAPPATSATPHPRPSVLPDSFTVLGIGRD